MDLALYTVDWDPEEVQLLALASLQLAAKMEEDTPPGPALFLPLAGDIYTKEDLARIEMELLQVGNSPHPFPSLFPPFTFPIPLSSSRFPALPPILKLKGTLSPPPLTSPLFLLSSKSEELG